MLRGESEDEEVGSHQGRGRLEIGDLQLVQGRRRSSNLWLVNGLKCFLYFFIFIF